MVSSVEATLGSLEGANININRWLERISTHRSHNEKLLLRKACKLAQHHHRIITRPSGEPILIHICSTVDILADLNMDTDTLVVAMIYELFNQQGIDLETIENLFGKKIVKLVIEVEKMRFLNNFSDNNLLHNDHVQVERLRKMLLALVQDVRVVLIKLADRLHDMRILRDLPRAEQLRIAHETQLIFAPLANRLGIWHLKWELEDTALRYLQPEGYTRLAKALDARRIDRQRCVEALIEHLSKELSKLNIEVTITGRAKHIYSIWRKMQRKKIDFHQIFDGLALRVLVNDVNDCYQVLGVVHSNWRPIKSEIDDYIAAPKPNGYRSLHTAVIGPNQKIFEVQIRTHEMHQHAELGVASHWRYKEGHVRHNRFFEKKLAWLRQVLSHPDEEPSLDDFNIDDDSERIYIISPKNEIIELQKNATPLDYAYQIHTHLGHRCRGAKINGHIVNLSHTLTTGDQVEIIGGSHVEPKRDWLNLELGYLNTSRARSTVRNWFNQQDKAQQIEHGNKVLKQELHRLNVPPVSLDKILASHKTFKDVNEMMAALGRGDFNVAQLSTLINEQVLPDKNNTTTSKKYKSDVQVSGVDGLLTKIASCCQPVPNEAIIGYISQGRGIIIHRQDCDDIKQWLVKRFEHFVEVSWKNQTTDFYLVTIKIRAHDRQGLLRDITNLLSAEKINIVSLKTKTNQDNIANMLFQIEVTGVKALSRSLLKLEQYPHIIDVTRQQQ